MAKYTGIKQGEVFLGNTDLREFPQDHYKHLKTVRLGEVALSIHGKDLIKEYPFLRPIFVSRKEEHLLRK